MHYQIIGHVGLQCMSLNRLVHSAVEIFARMGEDRNGVITFGAVIPASH